MPNVPRCRAREGSTAHSACGPHVVLAVIGALVVAACTGPAARRPPLPPVPHPTVQGPAVESIKRAGVLRVASDLSSPPMAFRDGEAPRGFEVDLAGLFAAALGVRLEVIDSPRAAIVAGLTHVDMAISALPLDGETGLVSEPYYVMSQAILWREGEVPIAEGTLRGVRVAAEAGSPARRVAEQLDAGSLILVYQPVQALDAVSRGQAQAAVGDLPLLLDYARTHRHLQVSTARWGEVPLVVVLPPDAPDLAAFTTEAIRELRTSGGLDQLRQRWHL